MFIFQWQCWNVDDKNNELIKVCNNVAQSHECSYMYQLSSVTLHCLNRILIKYVSVENIV